MPNNIRKGSKFFRVVFQLAVIAAAVGWVIYVVMEHGFPKPQQKESWQRHDGFVALSYGGLSRDEDGVHISRELFKSHMRALSEAGFETIAIDDITAFYRDNAPLPDKALYLMFEGGRKDSAIYGQEALSIFGMRASMYVHTSLLDRWNRSFLNRSQLTSLGKSSFWEIGTIGHNLYLDHGWYTGDRRRYYLNDFFRDEAGKRTESVDEYAKRARADYEETDGIIEALLGHKPKSYVFMPANTLYNSLDKDIALVNNDIMKERYDLVFTREGVAFNPRFSDRLDLTRMRIQEKISAEELLAEVENWLPNSRPFRLADAGGALRWQSDHGATAIDDNQFSLSADEGENAFVWLRGSDNWRNLAAQIRLADIAGGDNAECSLYFRFASRRSFIRLSLNETRLTVDERLPWGGLSVLFTADVPANPRGLFGIIVRNNRLWLTLDDRQLHQDGIPLSSAVTAGRVAVGLMRNSSPDTAQAGDESETWREPEPDSEQRAGDKSGDAATTGREPCFATFSGLDLVPLPEHWTVAEASTSQAGLSTGIVVPLPADPEATASLLLQAADDGLDRYALLPEGSLDADLPGPSLSALPSALGEKLWTGVIFTPGQDASWRELAMAMRKVRESGGKTVLKLDKAQTESMLAASTEIPADILVLRGEWLPDKETAALLRQGRSSILWERDGGKVYE
jgi:hypothetical protein